MQEIVFISRKTSPAGGIQKQLLYLAESLYRKKLFKPVLICTQAESGFAALFKNRGFEVFEVPMGKTDILSAAKKIIKLIDSRPVAGIQTHMFRESLIARLIRRKRKDIKHIFRAQTYIDCSANSAATKKLYHAIDSASSKYVDIYIANGAYLKDEIVARSGIDASKVEVVLNGSAVIGVSDEPAPLPQEPLAARIAVVANFVTGKGHDTLCGALEILNKNNLEVNARLIGSEVEGCPSSLKYIRQTAEKTGTTANLEFFGGTNDICGALRGIAVIVLASDSEGVPNCLLEAMSLRKLVIAADTGGVCEIIEGKKTGLLCAPRDAKGLADLLQYIFTHRAADFEQMRSAGFRRWEQEFTGEKMVSKFIKIYDKLKLLR